MRTVYVLPCGCGRRNRVTNLHTEFKCDRCRWLLVYATGNKSEWALTCPVRVRRLPPDARKQRSAAAQRGGDGSGT